VPIREVIAPDLASLLRLADQRQDRVVLGATDEFDLAGFGEGPQPIDDVLVAAFVEHLGEHAVDVDGRSGVRLLLEDVDQGAIRLVDDLPEHLRNLDWGLVEVEQLAPVNRRHSSEPRAPYQFR
jgi:hypothetical protein